MKWRQFIALISLSAAWPTLVQAQQQPTLGLLSSSEMPWAINPFRAGLEESGYVEGRNLTVIYRSAENQFDRLPALAAELVKSQGWYFCDRIAGPGAFCEGGHTNHTDRLCLWRRSG